MSTLLTLLESGHSNTLTKIIYMLEQTGYDWVADEIHADLQWEKGKVRIEDYIMQEAVYFANTLLSDRGFVDLSRKDDLSVIIASRHQVAKEAWKRQMTRKSERAKGELHSVQKDVMKMFQDVDRVLIDKDKWRIKGETEKEKERKKKKRAAAEEYSMSVKLLQERIDNLQQMLDNVISEYDKLMEERKACYGIVGAEPEEGSLSVVLNNMLKRVTKEIGQNSDDSNLKKNQINSLDKEVKALKKDLASQLSNKNQQITTLHRSMLTAERDLKDSLENLADMTRKRDIYKAQTDYWKERTEILEKTRRLGYYHFSRMHQPIPMKQDLPGTKTGTALYYDPQLLEAEGNIVYIKGDSNVRPPVAEMKAPTKTSYRLPSKGRRAIESQTYDPSFKDANLSSRKTPSIYHTRCIPDENTNTDTSKNKKKSLQASKSTPNLYQSDKNSAGRIRGQNGKPEDGPKAENKEGTSVIEGELTNGQRKKDNTYKGKPTPEMVTSGLNVSPYKRGNLSVLTTTTPMASYQNQPALNGDQAVTTYYTSDHRSQMVPSGIYRPVLMSQTAPRTNTQIVNPAIMRNTFFTYSEAGEEGTTLHARLGSLPENNHKNDEQSPKEKFNESVRVANGVEAAQIQKESSTKSSSSNGHAPREDAGKSMPSTSEEKIVSDSDIMKENEGKRGEGPNPNDGHCRCCPQCCKEAPTSHPYQGPLD